MAYFLPQTFSDILDMKDRGDSESATLEFKSCRLFNQKNDKVFETLSKEITAFANSIGGVLIIGVEEDEHRAISKVEPITDDKKQESWIEDGFLSRITPSLHFSITKIEAGEGFLLVINVPASRNAPHQSADKRYYARRLFQLKRGPTEKGSGSLFGEHGFSNDFRQPGDVARTRELNPRLQTFAQWIEHNVAHMVIV